MQAKGTLGWMIALACASAAWLGTAQVAKADGGYQQLYKLDRWQGGRWQEVPNLPFDVVGVAGTVQSGPIIFGGEGNRQVAYCNDYSSASWNFLPNAPFVIEGMCGSNQSGPLIFGGRRVAHLTSYSAAQWEELQGAPFEIRQITGENQTGLGALGNDGRSVAYMNNYGQGWKTLPQTPFPAKAIAGECQSGFIVLSQDGRRVAYLASFQAGTWAMAPNPPFEVAAMTGANRGGINAMSASGDVAVLQRYTGSWTSAPKAPFGGKVGCYAGENQSGLLATGPAASAPPPPPPPPPPPRDTTAPQIAVITPGDGSECGSEWVEVKIRVSDNESVAGCSINGAQAQSQGGGVWVARVKLGDGANTIRLEAWDNAGNRNTTGITVTGNFRPPQITAQAEATVIVSGRVDDPGATVTIDGLSVKLGADGSFKVRVPAPQSGSVTIVAVGRNGARSESRIQVR